MPIQILLPDGSTYAMGTDVMGNSVQRSGVVHTEAVAGHGGGDLGSLRPTPGQARAAEAVERLHKGPKVGGVQIVGYAGTGKTTLIRLFGKLYGDPKLIAPTGKAALRITEQTGLAASTFHRWMYDPGTNEQTGEPKFVLKHPSRLQLPSCRLVIVDEASMISMSSWADMWRTCQDLGLRIVLVGDGFQLPPVERSGGVRVESSGTFSTMTPEFATKHSFERVELTDIVRQALDSPVVRAAACFRLRDRAGLGILPKVEDLAGTAYRTLQAGGVVIAHTNNTRKKANLGLRQPVLSAGEPLLVLRNDYDLDVYNGQQLRFEGWERPPLEPMVVADKWRSTNGHATFGVGRVDGAKVILCPEQIDGSLDAGEIPVGVAARAFAKKHGLRCDGRPEIPMPILHANYGYCYTAHKAQGSEWPYALVILERTINLSQVDDEGWRWLYTAVTRSKLLSAIYFGTP